MLTNDTRAAGILNSTLEPVVTAEHTEPFPEIPDATEGITRLGNSTTWEQDMQKYLEKLDTSKATDPHDLSQWLPEDINHTVLGPVLTPLKGITRLDNTKKICKSTWTKNDMNNATEPKNISQWMPKDLNQEILDPYATEGNHTHLGNGTKQRIMICKST